ncbi:MAG: CPBP family intramembrane glutamic endopeptidase [Bacteroidota bacterium]
MNLFGNDYFFFFDLHHHNNEFSMLRGKIPFLKNKSYNSILLTGMFTVLVSILCLLIASVLGFSTEIQPRFGKMSFLMYALLAVILAPLFEEISFRGWFLRQRKYRIVSYVLFAVLCFALFYSVSWMAFAIVISAGLLIFWREKGKLLLPVIIGNSLIFSLFHFPSVQNIEIYHVFSFLSRFGMGLILCWTVINFSIKKSILVHFAFNATLIAFLFLGIQVVDTSQKKVEVGSVELRYQAKPYFYSNKTKFHTEEDRFHYENMKSDLIVHFTLFELELPEKIADEVTPVSHFSKYDIELIFKPTEDEAAKKIDAIMALKKAGIIKLPQLSKLLASKRQ